MLPIRGIVTQTRRYAFADPAGRIELTSNFEWPIAKVRDLISKLRRDGWLMDRQEGSHRQFRNATKRGIVTVNGHESDTLSHSLVRSIGLTREDLRK